MQYTLDVPAGYADDLKAAIEADMTETAGWSRAQRAKADDVTANANLAADEVTALTGQLAADCDLYIQAAGPGDEVEADADTLARICAAMARQVVGPRLMGLLHDDEGDEARELLPRLEWAVEQTARFRSAEAEARREQLRAA